MVITDRGRPRTKSCFFPIGWYYINIAFYCLQVISVISIAFVVVSTVGMTLNTIPSIQARNIKDEPIDNPKLALIEAVCISWFTIEYLLRFAGIPLFDTTS